MASDDERTALVVVLKVVVECSGDVTVGCALNCLLDATSILPGVTRKPHAGLAIERDEQVRRLLEYARLDGMLHLDAVQHLAVVERRIVGIIFVPGKIDGRVDVEGVELLSDFRNLVPVGLL